MCCPAWQGQHIPRSSLASAASNAVLAGMDEELLLEAGVVSFEPLFCNLAIGDAVEVGAGEGALSAGGRESLKLGDALSPDAVTDGHEVTLGEEEIRRHADLEGAEPGREHPLACFAAPDQFRKASDMADVIRSAHFV